MQLTVVAYWATICAMEHPLRKFRKSQPVKVTLDALGRRVGASKSFLSKIEKGKKTPSLALAVKISEATNGVVRPNDFLAPGSGATNETAS